MPKPFKNAKRASRANPREDRNLNKRFFDDNVISLDQEREQKGRSSFPRPKKPLTLIPKNPAQESFIDILESDTPYVIGCGSAGTGKTYCAVVAALKALQEGSISKIYITKPLMLVGDEKIGALPGSLLDKIRMNYGSFIDILEQFFHERDLEWMVENKIIDMLPLAYMRGRNLGDGDKQNCIAILDECQNVDSRSATFVTILSRINTGSRLFILGDQRQCDRRDNANGLVDLLERIERKPNPEAFGVVKFRPQDSVRSPLMKYILRDLYEQED